MNKKGNDGGGEIKRRIIRIKRQKIKIYRNNTKWNGVGS